MKLPVYNLEGGTTGEEVELTPEVFEIEPNDHAIAMAVHTEMTNRRQGTHATKNRALVRGGGKKPWRQKGRGAARAGTIRSPLWRGGGIIFGPQPHPYIMRINKKLNRLARRSVLTYKVREEKIRILQEFDWEDGKTKNARELAKAFNLYKIKALLLTSKYQPEVHNACKNIPGLEVNIAVDASARQLLNSDMILIQKDAIAAVQEVLNK